LVLFGGLAESQFAPITLTMPESREMSASETEPSPPKSSDCAESAMENEHPAELGRVLLLEDDAAFQEVIRDFLAENGYTVVPVKNGGEGVAQVLNGDFALVLCDLNMPGLPGDMFYRAVERIRPDLCSRFVFMTGYRGDAKVNDYVKSIGCWVLRKPFPLEDLLALFAFTSERPTMETICNWEAGTPDAAEPIAPTSGGPVPVPPLPTVVPTVTPVQTAGRMSWLEEASDQYCARREPSRWLDVAVIVAVVLGFQYLDENNAATAGLAEHRALQEQWLELSPQLEKATAAHAEFDRRAAEGAQNRGRLELRWTTALRDIALAINPSVEVREIQAQENPEDPGACEARIYGQTSGEQPRVAADRFRRSIEGFLATDMDARVVNTRLEQLEDVPAGPDGLARCSFVAIITVNPSASVAMLKKGDR
jgi:CheY-like chemotaxis protein